ncbi:MAG: oxidoreductase [Methanomassiliicoccaceae archaeon]|nr:oxidoreductase [Methanomassiliicoccaceae archaeon]
MDGKVMNLRIEKGRNGDFWADQLPEGISLVRLFDKCIMIAAAASFLIALAYILYQEIGGGSSVYDVMPWLALPFFVCGVIFYIRTKYWTLLALAAAAAVLWFINIPEALIFLLLFLVIGAAGVVAVVDAVQRSIFYKVLRRIEYINVKSKLTAKDKMTAFLFNVPEDMDTRNITMDYELSRTKMPWKEVLNSISLGLMVGMFIWIYISMNPAFMDLSSETSVPLLMFTLILYIPVLVMPWSIFRSLNVRIETNYRDFKVYGGIKATLQRMAVPVIAALFFVLVAINTSDIYTVAYYIALSAAMIVATLTLVSVLYYWVFEAVTINDIISKWKMFRPVSVFAGLNDHKRGQQREDLPGTPKRDKSDFGKLVLPEEK